MSDAKCKHDDFFCECDVTRLSDSGAFTLDVRVKCKQCGIPFEFIGLPRGLNLKGAAMSFDGTEGRFAICPKGEEPPSMEGLPSGFTITPRHIVDADLSGGEDRSVEQHITLGRQYCPGCGKLVLSDVFHTCTRDVQ